MAELHVEVHMEDRRVEHTSPVGAYGTEPYADVGVTGVSIGPGSGADGDLATAIGVKVGEIAGYVSARGLHGLRTDAEEQITNRPLISLALGAGLGYLIGRTLRG